MTKTRTTSAASFKAAKAAKVAKATKVAKSAKASKAAKSVESTTDTKEGSEDTKEGSKDTEEGSQDSKEGSEDTKEGSQDSKEGSEDTKEGTPAAVEFSDDNVFSQMSTNPCSTELDGKDYVYFGSGLDKTHRMLSNFSNCLVTGDMFVKTDGVGDGYSKRSFTFPSAEHYWWAHFMEREVDIERIAVGGDFSTVRRGLSVLNKSRMSSEKIAQKSKYWVGRECVGVVAKQLANIDKKLNARIRAEKHGIRMQAHPLSMYGATGEMGTLVSIWKNILSQKYSQNKAHREALVGTGDKHLVEFCRMRASEHFWAGQVKNGILYGRNFMGWCHMTARKEFV